jgi:2,4-dienoyl-CoA reductase-like NADH-dependent reductase (Old Yellow Enzyme family)
VRNIAFIFAREALDRGDDHIGRDARRILNGCLHSQRRLAKESAELAIERGEPDAAAFGRPFIANPDLAGHLRRGSSLNAVVPETIDTDYETDGNDHRLLDEAV